MAEEKGMTVRDIIEKRIMDEGRAPTKAESKILSMIKEREEKEEGKTLGLTPLEYLRHRAASEGRDLTEAEKEIELTLVKAGEKETSPKGKSVLDYIAEKKLAEMRKPR